jgi:hypothetical protein
VAQSHASGTCPPCARPDGAPPETLRVLVSSALYQIYALRAALIALRRQTSQDIPRPQPRVLYAKPDATYDDERPLLMRPGLSRKRSWPLSDIRVVDLVLYLVSNRVLQ